MEQRGPDVPLQALVREHAALRRVATLVAREPSPSVGGEGMRIRPRLPTEAVGSPKEF